MPEPEPYALPETPVHLATAEEVAAFGARLSTTLTQGDVLTLYGDLGAGKTTLARGLIQAWLNDQGLDPEEVPSPTFTLVQVYEGRACDLWHVDLYRIESLSEIAELALDDAADAGILVIEWPERFGPLLPEDRLDVHIDILADGARQVRLERHGRALERERGPTANRGTENT